MNIDLSFSAFHRRQQQNREYKMREPIGDEAYRVIMGISFRNKKDRYKSDANVRIYLMFDKVTQNGMAIGEEKMVEDFYADLINDNWDKLVDFIKENEKKNKEKFENEQAIKKTKKVVEFSKFTPVTYIPLPDNPQKCIVLYVKDKELGETQEEQNAMIKRVSERLNGDFYKVLSREILKQFNLGG